MPNEVTDTRVRRVSLVRRAATRDPENPSEPRRCLLWKAEGAATVTPAAPYVETPADAKARRLNKLLDAMAEEIEVMRGDGSPAAVVQSHERALGAVHAEMVACHDPAAARLLRGETDNDDPDERTHMLTDLEKRAIGRPATEPPASSGLLTDAEIEKRQGKYADLLAELESDMRTMRANGTAPHVLARHENAHRELAHAYAGLDAQRGLAERVAPMVKAEDSPIAKADIALRKAGLSPTEALRVAIASNPDAYYAEGGVRRGGSGTSESALAKAAGDTDYAEHGASVDARASALEKSEGLSPTAAYRKALSAAGVYESAAG